MTKSAAAKRNGKARATPGAIGVAVYCRVSVADGLDSRFNSLDAQEEAIRAYIASQRSAGWIALPEAYVDAGCSGANLDRPAFTRLLADIEIGRIDAVAVYRTDRLSRSLLDFTKLMATFEEQGIAYVSVTERFDSSSPMGRMAMQMLASFAEFERATISQRTSDKMAASRRRGLWTGGRPPLGYDVSNKQLVVNAEEAEQVKAVFQLYSQLGSLLDVAAELRERGWTTKSWVNGKGVAVRGVQFTKGAVHSLLQNPLYIGRIKAADQVVEAAHEAIIDLPTWEAVQARLRVNQVSGSMRSRGGSKGTALLSGLARCAACGAGLLHHYTKKGAKQWSYYVCATHGRRGAASCPGSRIAAGELERIVIEHIAEIGRDPAILEATLAADRSDREARRPELAAEVRRLTAVRTRIEGERRNLVDALGQGGAGTNVLLQRFDELDQAQADAEQCASAAQSELQALEIEQIDPGELRAALHDMTALWEVMFPKERARVLALLIEKVELDAGGGEIAITFRPGGPKAMRGKAMEAVR